MSENNGLYSSPVFSRSQQQTSSSSRSVDMMAEATPPAGLNNITEELSKVVAELVSPEKKGDAENEALERNTNRLLYLLEKILEHGLKENVSMFATSSAWYWLEQLDECLPGSEVKEMITLIRSTASTTFGRTRVFLRYTLNQGALTEDLSALIWNTTLTEKYYRQGAIVRHPETSNLFLEVIEPLKNLKFQVDFEDKLLDSIDYWQKLVEARKRGETLSSKPNGEPVFDTDTLKSLSTLSPRQLTEKLKTMSHKPGRRTLTADDTALFHRLDQQTTEAENTKRELERAKEALKSAESQMRSLIEENNSLKHRLDDINVELSIYKNNASEPLSPIVPFQLRRSVDTSLAEDTEQDDEMFREHELMVERMEKASAFIKQMKENDAKMKEKILLACAYE
ncbi:hypothetical protein PROFUN_07004 [Planoprotostelium fungivorum]|uniref:RUN domain-containing protein n=1 Tax=Planoprotostelium fungivorum TaxID=1890364 RepID=A0A2P6NMP3_9EUKA|nr:hypothetical protein PROFUN_07004 [Planoprotostelium fungivorum]